MGRGSPPHAETGFVLARADGEVQRALVGRQVADRVGFFLRVDDFELAHAQLLSKGVEVRLGTSI